MASEFYSGASSFGRGYAFVSAVIVTIISLLMIAGGIYFFYLSTQESSVLGKVSSVGGSGSTEVCSASQTTKQGVVTEYQCPNVVATYTVAGTSYTSAPPMNMASSSSSISIGDSVYVKYQDSDPSVVESLSQAKISYKTWAYILIGFALVFLIFTWLNVWLTRKYKAYAAISGAADAFNVARQL